MTDGLYGLRYTIPSPGSPCNSFALTTLHCRRCRNWISLKSAETLFSSYKLPHCSYTHAEFNCFRRCGPDTIEILTGDLEHWSDPNLTVHKSFSTVACLSDALDWHHSSTGRADGDAKEKHARRWQKGTYRLKEHLLPDVRDTDVEMVDSSSAHQLPVHS